MADEAKQPEPAPVAPGNAPAAIEPQAAAAPAPAAKPLALPDDCNVVDCSSGKQQFWRFAKGKTQMKLVHVRETTLLRARSQLLTIVATQLQLLRLSRL